MCTLLVWRLKLDFSVCWSLFGTLCGCIKELISTLDTWTFVPSLASMSICYRKLAIELELKSMQLTRKHPRLNSVGIACKINVARSQHSKCKT